jgi:hypothetical protein
MQELLYDLTYKFYTESGTITDWVYSVGHTRSRGEEGGPASFLHPLPLPEKKLPSKFTKCAIETYGR